ncbi:MAG: exosortase-associated EpsI family protein [Pirellulales bacterium]|nr:exosortase-associated EpsI family protein [Pirellulales bacterium]
MKKTIFIAIAVLIACGLTLTSGVIQGQLSNRWGPPPAMITAAEQLKGVPSHFGSWRITSEDDVDELTRHMLQLAGYVNRSYVDEETGQVVHVAVLLGPAGRISVHTPEVCFSSREYNQMDPRKRVTVKADKNAEEYGELWQLTFRSRDVSRHQLCVYYGWSRGGRWSASESARWEYAGSPYLYKIQLAARVPPGKTAEEFDPCKKFLVDFLPVLKPHLQAPR